LIEWIPTSIWQGLERRRFVISKGKWCVKSAWGIQGREDVDFEISEGWVTGKRIDHLSESHLDQQYDVSCTLLKDRHQRTNWFIHEAEEFLKNECRGELHGKQLSELTRESNNLFPKLLDPTMWESFCLLNGRYRRTVSSTSRLKAWIKDKGEI
jgi:hypothetical protein